MLDVILVFACALLGALGGLVLGCAVWGYAYINLSADERAELPQPLRIAGFTMIAVVLGATPAAAVAGAGLIAVSAYYWPKTNGSQRWFCRASIVAATIELLSGLILLALVVYQVVWGF